MLLIDEFTVEQLIQIAEENARKHYPNPRVFAELMNRLHPGLHLAINSETGEINKEMNVSHFKIDAAVSAFWREFERMKNAPPIDERGIYFQMFLDFHQSVESKLTHTDRTRLMKLAIKQFKNKQAFNTNGIGMTSSEIAALWGVSQKKVSDSYLTRYLKMEYLKKKKVGRTWHYTFHSKALLMGRVGGDKLFTKVFYSKLADVEARLNIIMKTQKKENKYDPLGTLHFILPYFQYETLYLAKNPKVSIMEGEDDVNAALSRDNARKYKKIKYMSIAELKRRISAAHTHEMKQHIIVKHLNWIERAGAIKIDRTYGKIRILLHPHLGGNVNLEDPYILTILNQFGVHTRNKD